MFTAWVASCLSCPWSPADRESKSRRQAAESKGKFKIGLNSILVRPDGSNSRSGIERQMEICHSQPHLIPPMKLVFYDNLPSPGPPPRSSILSTWMAEGRNLASRPTSWASLPAKRKRAQRPVIGPPSDFRKLDPIRHRREPFHPLELSIFLPGSRLSDLPEFDKLALRDAAQLSPPPKALSAHPGGPHRCCSESASFRLPRKPVGSGSRRSSLASVEQLADQGKESTNPLIPHFSVRMPDTVSEGAPLRQFRPRSRPLDRCLSEPSVGQVVIPEEYVASGHRTQRPTTLIPNVPDKPLPSIPQGDPWCPSTPKSDRCSAPIKWRFHESPESMSTTPSNKGQTSPYSSQQPYQSLSPSRSRTLSDSSFSSAMTAIGHRTVPSLSSDFTAATTLHVPSPDLCKEVESDIPIQLVLDPHPTSGMEEQGLEYGYDRHFPESGVGLAF
jgi:hypothetical protein